MNAFSIDLSLITQIYTSLGLQTIGTLDDLNKIGQEKLLRASGKERWQLEQSFEEKREQLILLLRKAGFVNPIQLPRTAYTYLIILGAREEDVRKRINCLVDYLKSMRISSASGTVVILSGSRPLDPEQEDISLGSTEAQMIESLMKVSPLAHYSYQVIDAPMKLDNKGNPARPTTDDTVHAWLKQHPVPGNCLVVSSQPFVQRQVAVLRTLLPQDFIVEGIGTAADDTLPIAVYLDELARTIYQEKRLQERH